MLSLNIASYHQDSLIMNMSDDRYPHKNLPNIYDLIFYFIIISPVLFYQGMSNPMAVTLSLLYPPPLLFMYENRGGQTFWLKGQAGF